MSCNSGAGRDPGRRRQRAGFSIFVDQVVDAQGGQQWETRLYHAESGIETTLAGACPDHWIDWILKRLGPGFVAESGPEAISPET